MPLTMIRRLIILLLIVGCGTEPEDCAGVAGGAAGLDSCAVCIGGTTNLTACVQDCADLWGGTAVEDDCGVCNGIDGYVAGSCYDCVGVANGTAVEDCLGNCGGEANIDECGVCGGEGAIYECGCSDIPNGDCDCDGNVLDECGVCGGDGSTCIVCADCSDSECCDCDGNVYETVQIGEQLWMAENLKTTHYNDGSEITLITNNEDWGSFDEGQYGVYNNDSTIADIYGNLYNFAVVDDSRGVCPEGFYVPSDAEYTVLTDYLGGTSVAGGKMKESGHEHWNYYNDQITSEASNESGFTGIPAGYRFGSNGLYGSMGIYGYFWSSSDSSYGAWYRLLNYGNPNVLRSSYYKHSGFSVRCLGE